MPTLEQVTDWGDDFDREYPEELADRLRWFVERLGVLPERVLRLLGLSRERAQEVVQGGIDWKAAVAEASEEAAWWAERTLAGALRLYRYDWRALRERIRRPADREFEVVQPGGTPVPASGLPSDQREEVLLLLACQEMSQAREALLAYLSQPANAAACS
jgi:hypothetical protein